MPVTINGTTGIAGVDGSAGTPAVQGADSNTGIFFPAADTIAFAEGGAEVARFDSSGNFGLGTSSPTTVGGVALCVYDASTPRIRLTNSSTGNTSTDGGEISLFNSELSIENRESANINFYNGGSLRARIDSSGNLLVGTTSDPSGSNVNTMAVANVNNGKGGILVGNTGGSAATTAMRFYNSNGIVGTIVTSGSATSYNASSDYRLKHDIAPMTGALAKVAALKPVTYKWNVDGSDGEGFIAHELAEVCPQAVTGEKDAVETYVDEDGNEQTRPVYQGIDTSFLVATLTAAIQEQQALIESLTARIAALEAA